MKKKVIYGWIQQHFEPKHLYSVSRISECVTDLKRDWDKGEYPKKIRITIEEVK